MKDFKHISVRRMTKRFGEKTALHEFSLDFDKGEFVTFLGPSGCGKSTALNCITGLIPISSGEIYIDDECIDDSRDKIAPEKREFGMVFQNYALFPHLSVFDNVAFGLRLRKHTKKSVREKVDTALRLVHLEGYGSKFPAQMSGGEQQRVAIARCIVLEPRLLLLDEPLSNLDAKLRVELRYELKALHERLRVTTIYVTHDQTEALALSDRIVVMRAGKIQQVGTPEEVFSDPANLFVADFMGFKNMWKAKLESLSQSPGHLDAVVKTAGGSLRARLRYPEGDPRRSALVAAHASGKPVVTAIRPEDILLRAQEGMNTLGCTATLVEYQGQQSQVSACFDASGPEGAADRIDFRSAERVEEGRGLQLGVAPDRLLLFPELETAATTVEEGSP
ncbi:MAG TPA: ABC transporter ATP-binding protein [Rectinemataceae bacterium]|nr:ABC transporter ATP-binding protein [Rectinemataceae bacterium]